ncbi:MAG TPA: hypothetical protein VEQ63_10065 [Bryobacteraceae bacterium]|nr:hypothetical protein [Bryobacteraceae bacterium]
MNDQEKLAIKDMGDLPENGQTSNKAGLRSDARKPSNAGPDSHEEHKAPVAGAFGNDETREEDQRDTALGNWVPADKARK